MQITFKLYAHLGDLLPTGARQNRATIEVDPATTLNQIIDHFHIPREMAHLVLVNGVYINADERDTPGRLQPGDVLAIWPPVAGG